MRVRIRRFGTLRFPVQADLSAVVAPRRSCRSPASLSCRAAPYSPARALSSARCRASMVAAAASSLVARAASSARVPPRCFDALRGSFTPSMANIARPISPCRSHTASTAANTVAIAVSVVLMKCAIVVKGGRVSPQRAMKGHLFLARASDGAAAHDAARVRTEHDREPHRGRVGGCARGIVSEPGIKPRQVELVRHQMVNRARTCRGRVAPPGRRLRNGDWYRGAGSAPWGGASSQRGGCERRATRQDSPRFFYSLVGQTTHIT